MSATQPTVHSERSKSDTDEKCEKQNQTAAVKKYKREPRQPSHTSHTSHKESNFERCKKLGLLKRNTAQDRLKKIRSNLPNAEIKKKIYDKIETFQKSETKERALFKDILLEKFVCEESCRKPEKKPSHFTADSRLKRIKLAFLKKNAIESDSSPSDLLKHESQLVIPNTCSQKDDDDGEKRKNSAAFDRSSEETHSKAISTTVPESSSGNETMDVDMETDNGVNKSQLGSSNGSNFWPDITKSNINTISAIRKEPSYLALYDNLCSDSAMNLAIPAGDLFVVVDTNIFLSHLSFISKLLKCDISPYRNPVIVVPWLVIQEIDYSMKKNNTELSSRARTANTFIYDCLKKKHPRFFGQSLQEFRVNFKNAVCIDDYILNYCLKFVSMDNTVILLTDDINLCNKSMVNQLNVYTKAEFAKRFDIA